uniref:Uncharacterized protein n=1 Tax=Knipowitschia caucasica TaxID=637954 RepID=A0AAV2LB68_KNICA
MTKVRKPHQRSRPLPEQQTNRGRPGTDTRIPIGGAAETPHLHLGTHRTAPIQPQPQFEVGEPLRKPFYLSRISRSETWSGLFVRP